MGRCSRRIALEDLRLRLNFLTLISWVMYIEIR